jgi:hypothetical protein
MKDITNINAPSNLSALPFALSQSTPSTRQTHPVLAGFAKVLSGGRVVNLQKDKPFVDRMLSDGISTYPTEPNKINPPLEQVILESVAINLEAGVKLLDTQELVLAKMGGRLSEMALSFNIARQNIEHAQDAQQSYEDSLANFRRLSKETFDHTALFSMGTAKPVTVVVPTRTKWEGLSIDRCNLSTPGLQSLDVGKVSPHAKGLLLDSTAFTFAFNEWRSMCANNRLQWHLVYNRWRLIVDILKHFIGGRKWCPPPFPDDLKQGTLSRPHLNN